MGKVFISTDRYDVNIKHLMFAGSEDTLKYSIGGKYEGKGNIYQVGTPQEVDVISVLHSKTTYELATNYGGKFSKYTTKEPIDTLMTKLTSNNTLIGTMTRQIGDGTDTVKQYILIYSILGRVKR